MDIIIEVFILMFHFMLLLQYNKLTHFFFNRLLVQIHDEILLEVADSDVNTVSGTIQYSYFSPASI